MQCGFREKPFYLVEYVLFLDQKDASTLTTRLESCFKSVPPSGLLFPLAGTRFSLHYVPICNPEAGWFYIQPPTKLVLLVGLPHTCAAFMSIYLPSPLDSKTHDGENHGLRTLVPLTVPTTVPVKQQVEDICV